MGIVYYDVGDTVTYMSGDCDPFKIEKVGVITEISSDNFDEVKVDSGKYLGQEVKDILVYWSKKTKSWRPVKEKDMGSIFFEIKGKGKDPIDYVLIEELV